MPEDMIDDPTGFLIRQAPYDALPPERLAEVIGRLETLDLPAGARAFTEGDALTGLYIIRDGTMSITDATGVELSHLGPGNSFGERGLLRGGTAVATATAAEPTRLYRLPAPLFFNLMQGEEAFRRFFDRSRPDRPQTKTGELTATRVEDLMTRDPATCEPGTPIRVAARTMRDRRISSLCITDGGKLFGIVTLRDLVNKALAEDVGADTPVAGIMTPDPATLPPTAIGSDVLHRMMERRLGHLPIVAGDQLVGIVTQTDLTRFLASTSAGLMADIGRADSAEDIARVTARIPELLAQLVAGGNRHEVVTRLVTDIADGATRRLIRFFEGEYGPAPVPYAWVACGSQGRQEQTGVSDQDNALIIDDAATEADMAWFAGLAEFVCAGLDKAGYVFCPGEMMAKTPRWRQRVLGWRGYFADWIAHPSKEAQMLASVMFDLRVIEGDEALYRPLQAAVLKGAAENSIFRAHMAANAVGHVPPLGLIRGFATLRSGEHRNRIDMKMNGVVPIVDLGRAYALQGGLEAANTRDRIEAAGAAKVISESGARDLLDAYDVIAQARLDHQMRQIRRGEAPDNFMAPSELSDLERSHLRDAFVVVKTMQSALMSGRGVMG